MTNLLSITLTSLLATFARRVLRAWQGLRSVWRFGRPLSVAEAQKRRVCRICKIDSMPGPSNAFIFNHGEEYAHEKCLKHLFAVGFILLALTINAFAQVINVPDFHLQTNVVRVPCQKFYYYGVQADGGIVDLGPVCDHEMLVFEAKLPPALSLIFRVNTPLDGIVTVRQPGTASLRGSRVGGYAPGTPAHMAMPPLPPSRPSLLQVTNFVPTLVNSAFSPLPPPPDEPPLLPPQPWQQELFRYLCLPGQEPRPDATGQLSGFACLFSFLAESNKCYRICASTDGQLSWRPLTSICPAAATGPNIVPMPVGNFPESCQLAPDPLTQTGLGYWSVSTNLMVTANNVAYKLESHY